MCGRYALTFNLAEICAFFATQTSLSAWEPHYNLGPGMQLPIIIKGRLGLAQWGWPSIAAGVKPLINIRSETAANKPSFARSWNEGRHALVPASGFYEWDASGQPYYVQDASQEIMAFKALWTRDENDKPCFAILTEAATGSLLPIHPRAPQMVGVKGQAITQAMPIAVGRGVNDIGQNSPALMEPTLDATQGNLWVA